MVKRHIKINWSTADLTVFDVILLINRTIDQNIKCLTTVGTFDLSLF